MESCFKCCCKSLSNVFTVAFLSEYGDGSPAFIKLPLLGPRVVDHRQPDRLAEPLLYLTQCRWQVPLDVRHAGNGCATSTVRVQIAGIGALQGEFGRDVDSQDDDIESSLQGLFDFLHAWLWSAQLALEHHSSSILEGSHHRRGLAGCDYFCG